MAQIAFRRSQRGAPGWAHYCEREACGFSVRTTETQGLEAHRAAVADHLADHKAEETEAGDGQVL